MSEPAIVLQSVSKSFGKKEVIQDVTFKVDKGEIFGLLGPSGSGKTTIIKMIVGIEEPTNGEASVLGVRMPDLNMLKNIGFMAQSDALYSELTGKENVSFFASLSGLRGKNKKERIEYVLDLVNLAEHAGKRTGDYSGGMKRRLSLAIAMLNEPQVLVLDEPTVGIDPILRQSIWEELERIRQSGTAIVVTTHVMDEAEKCGRIGFVRDGKLIAAGTPEELKSEAKTATIEGAFLAYGGERK
ncbi:ABC transporter ATP-binding protein [Metabacillus sp. cB07]|uniref:ABC transporter ATP-binding protein n=1 Tax=Metabacillus sp. cB07 TaxID=2806989 RepID=UPI001939EEFA|nr:ABC transporter ATP-binding protein [Metabacillus sp. cB07]